MLFEGLEIGEVVGMERFALDDRAVDLGVVEPAGVDGGVYDGEVEPGAVQAIDGAFAAVGGAVVDSGDDAQCVGTWALIAVRRRSQPVGLSPARTHGHTHAKHESGTRPPERPRARACPWDCLV